MRPTGYGRISWRTCVSAVTAIRPMCNWRVADTSPYGNEAQKQHHGRAVARTVNALVSRCGKERMTDSDKMIAASTLAFLLEYEGLCWKYAKTIVPLDDTVPLVVRSELDDTIEAHLAGHDSVTLFRANIRGRTQRYDSLTTYQIENKL